MKVPALFRFILLLSPLPWFPSRSVFPQISLTLPFFLCDLHLFPFFSLSLLLLLYVDITVEYACRPGFLKLFGRLIHFFSLAPSFFSFLTSLRLSSPQLLLSCPSPSISSPAGVFPLPQPLSLGLLPIPASRSDPFHSETVGVFFFPLPPGTSVYWRVRRLL